MANAAIPLGSLPSSPMKFQPDRINGANVIQACTEDSVTINHQVWRTSVFLPSCGDVCAWDCVRFDVFSDLSLAQFLDPQYNKTELILIGTGRRLRFIAPQRLQPLWARHIGVEVMGTAAACRTYNILVAEGRRVIAGLLLDVGEAKHQPAIGGQAPL